MKFQVSHRTAYTYRSKVAQSCHLLHLKPRQLPTQTVLHHSLLVEPAPAARSEIVDAFGNAATILSIEEEHTDFIVHARSTVEIPASTPTDLATSSPWEHIADLAQDSDGGLNVDVLQFTCWSRHAPILRDLVNFAAPSFPAERPVLVGALDLAKRIHGDFVFDPRATDISTPILRVLQTRRGVCQDFAHLMIATLRSLGIPARYVSGYLLTHPPAGQPKLRGADASHAWLSVWAPQIGWVDFDPTNGIVPTDEHITVAYGRDYEDISPIGGVLLGGGDQMMTVAVDVEPELQTPARSPG